MLTHLNGLVDYISLHTYIGNRENSFEQFLGASQDIDHRIAVVDGLIKAAQSGQPKPRPIFIAYDEWNVWYRARGTGSKIQRLEEVYNYEDALAMGMFFNSFFRRADIVKMANLAQLVNGIAPIFTNKDGLFLQPIYFTLAEYARQKGNQSLDLFVQSPTYTVNNGRPLNYLDTSATYDAKTGTVFVNVLNRSEKLDIAARIEHVGGAVNGQVGVWELNHTDLKATHTFGDDKKVRPVTRTATVAVSGNGFAYTFPAHSLTILAVKAK